MTSSQIEQSLVRALNLTRGSDAAPLLVSAMRYAVLPGGARVRPRLCLAVAGSCAMEPNPLALAAAAGIELLHCASLVHDDLPCFDNAAMRRGRPSVHKKFGEQIAVLTGDALIALAFQAVVAPSVEQPRRVAAVVSVIASAAGAPSGIASGQAWECEPTIDLSVYQRTKTGALFAAAAAAGASAAGHAHRPWYPVGNLLGEAYQVADDVRDVHCNETELGKPCNQDLALCRPNAVHQLGMAGAIRRLEELVDAAVAAVPPCPGARDLQAHIRAEAGRLLPRELARPAA
jgi:geranylgeranyl diphosphate synthase type II